MAISTCLCLLFLCLRTFIGHSCDGIQVHFTKALTFYRLSNATDKDVESEITDAWTESANETHCISSYDPSVCYLLFVSIGQGTVDPWQITLNGSVTESIEGNASSFSYFLHNYTISPIPICYFDCSSSEQWLTLRPLNDAWDTSAWRATYDIILDINETQSFAAGMSRDYAYESSCNNVGSDKCFRVQVANVGFMIGLGGENMKENPSSATTIFDSGFTHLHSYYHYYVQNGVGQGDPRACFQCSGLRLFVQPSGWYEDLSWKIEVIHDASEVNATELDGVDRLTCSTTFNRFVSYCLEYLPNRCYKMTVAANVASGGSPSSWALETIATVVVVINDTDIVVETGDNLYTQSLVLYLNGNNTRYSNDSQVCFPAVPTVDPTSAPTPSPTLAPSVSPTTTSGSTHVEVYTDQYGSFNCSGDGREDIDICIVICPNKNSCRFTSIYCPIKHNSACNLYAQDTAAGSDTTIYGENAKSLYLHAEGPFTWSNAYIEFNGQKNNNLTMIADANLSRSFDGTYVNTSATFVNISCAFGCANFAFFDDPKLVSKDDALHELYFHKYVGEDYVMLTLDTAYRDYVSLVLHFTQYFPSTDDGFTINIQLPNNGAFEWQCKNTSVYFQAEFFSDDAVNTQVDIENCNFIRSVLTFEEVEYLRLYQSSISESNVSISSVVNHSLIVFDGISNDLGGFVSLSLPLPSPANEELDVYVKLRNYVTLYGQTNSTYPYHNITLNCDSSYPCSFSTDVINMLVRQFNVICNGAYTCRYNDWQIGLVHAHGGLLLIADGVQSLRDTVLTYDASYAANINLELSCKDGACYEFEIAALSNTTIHLGQNMTVTCDNSNTLSTYTCDELIVTCPSLMSATTQTTNPNRCAIDMSKLSKVQSGGRQTIRSYSGPPFVTLICDNRRGDASCVNAIVECDDPYGAKQCAMTYSNPDKSWNCSGQCLDYSYQLEGAYFVSSSQRLFHDMVINCSAANAYSTSCHVLCNDDNSCQDLSVYCPIASDASVCSLTCNGASGCHNVQIFGQNSQSLYVTCNGDESCWSMKVYHNNKRSKVLAIGGTSNIAMYTLKNVKVYSSATESNLISCSMPYSCTDCMLNLVVLGGYGHTTDVYCEASSTCVRLKLVVNWAAYYSKRTRNRHDSIVALRQLVCTGQYRAARILQQHDEQQHLRVQTT
ncbi:hypothetical protein RFI_13916 [Reticulomyxa filosa]|uniref:Uncharacterized protein n=1 Tax=Reticulomyxa filosa TaxID=46433 RepID=X6ND58_RETFI|nr:hypothetical protein RFI_13916 [Reticulomyxa filosa]|eukprot:ETO23267.1 hypothetical protein RFI_13916 [Reticulomyxa filosa]